MKANVNFMQGKEFEEKRCSICGKPILCTSQIILQGGYGSKYDMERLVFDVCSDCFDSLTESFLERNKRG